MIRQYLILLMLCVFPLVSNAQMRLTSRGNLLLGSFYGSTLNQTNNSDQNFIFINGQYQGLRMVNGNSVTAQPCFQIDLTKGSPCIFGSNGSSTGEVDFCDGGIYWNTLMVRNTYIGMDGYLHNGLYQPLKEVSAILTSLTGPNGIQSKNELICTKHNTFQSERK